MTHVDGRYTLASHTDTHANAYVHQLTLSCAGWFVLITWVRLMKFLRVVKEVGVLVEVREGRVRRRCLSRAPLGARGACNVPVEPVPHPPLHLSPSCVPGDRADAVLAQGSDDGSQRLRPLPAPSASFL